MAERVPRVGGQRVVEVEEPVAERHVVEEGLVEAPRVVPVVLRGLHVPVQSTLPRRSTCALLDSRLTNGHSSRWRPFHGNPDPRHSLPLVIN